MRNIFPSLEPFATEFIDVGNGHEIYVERSGNPKGQPVLLLHGGPGSSGSNVKRQYFDPQKYLIIYFHQRGCGLSKYSDPLKANTTWDLVADIEKIRKKMEITTWHVYGASWGVALALAYAEAYPKCVRSLHLRGVYLGSYMENSWLFEHGARNFFPEKYAPLDDFMKQQGLEVTLKNLNELIFSQDFELAYQTAKLCDNWELGVMDLVPTEEAQVETTLEEKQKLLVSKRIMFQYMSNNCYFKTGQLLRNVDMIRKIPAVIIQGRYDLIAPFITAWKLHQAWPEAAFEVITLAGHHHTEPEVQQKILEYTDKFAKL